MNKKIIFSVLAGILLVAGMVSAISNDLEDHVVFDDGKGSYDEHGYFDDEFSVAAWIKIDTWSNTDGNDSQTIAQQRCVNCDAGERSAFILGVNGKLDEFGPKDLVCEEMTDIYHKLGFLAGRNVSDCDQWVWSDEEIDEDEWYHVVVTYDGDESVIYINGDKDNDANIDALADGYTSELGVGVVPNDVPSGYTGWQDFYGDIDNFYIFDKALDEDEVEDLYEDERDDFDGHEDDDDNDKKSRSTNRPLNDMCNPVWECTGWSECIDGYRTRVCNDFGECSVDFNKPIEVQACEPVGTGNIVLNAKDDANYFDGFNWLTWLLIAILVLLIIVAIVVLLVR